MSINFILLVVITVVLGAPVEWVFEGLQAFKFWER